MGELLLITVALGNFLALGWQSPDKGLFDNFVRTLLSSGELRGWMRALGSLRAFLELHICWLGMVESESREVEGDLRPKQLHSIAQCLSGQPPSQARKKSPAPGTWTQHKGASIDFPLHLIELTTQSPTMSCKAVMLTRTI